MTPKLSIEVIGPAATELALRLFPCTPCAPSRRLAITFSDFPKGSTLTMPTIGVLAVLALAVPQKALGHLSYTDPSLPAPTGLTAVSDNSAIIVTPTDDPLAFFVGGDGSNAVTGNVTFTDSDGNTLVVSVTTSVTPPPPVATLGITFDAPVSI